MRASFARTPRFWTGRMTKTGSANKRIPNAFWKDAPNATDEKRIEFRKKNWIYLALCLPEQLFLFMIWALIRWANFSVKLEIYWKKWTISSLSAAFGIELGLIPDLNELHLRHIAHNAHCTHTRYKQFYDSKSAMIKPFSSFNAIESVLPRDLFKKWS